MHADARGLIATLQLEPLAQEGGFFRQTWCGASGSAILFLITIDDFSALHRIAQDEMWHFYAGDAVDHVQLDPQTGEAQTTRLGSDYARGAVPQLVVPRGVWQGACVAAAGTSRSDGARGFALLGCTVTPPWDPVGFELGRRDELMRLFPAHATRVRALTR